MFFSLTCEKIKNGKFFHLQFMGILITVIQYLLCILEPMWTCYAAFCLERMKRKTNVPELQKQVAELSSSGIKLTENTGSLTVQELNVKSVNPDSDVMCYCL